LTIGLFLLIGSLVIAFYLIVKSYYLNEYMLGFLFFPFIIFIGLLVGRIEWIENHLQDTMETTTPVHNIQFLDDTNVISYIVNSSGPRVSQQFSKNEYNELKATYTGQFLIGYSGKPTHCYINTYSRNYETINMKFDDITLFECY
jgi:hypothetical protein